MRSVKNEGKTEKELQLPPILNNYSFKQRDQLIVSKEESIFSYGRSVLRIPEFSFRMNIVTLYIQWVTKVSKQSIF